jgi:hypothetical protein
METTNWDILVGDTGNFFYNEEYSAMLGMEVFNYVVLHESENEDIIHGLAVKAPTSGQFLDGMINIPSAGFYMSISGFLRLTLAIENKTVHTIGEDYIPDKYKSHYVETSQLLPVTADGDDITNTFNDRPHEWLCNEIFCWVDVYVTRSNVTKIITFGSFLCEVAGGIVTRIGLANDESYYYLLFMIRGENRAWSVRVQTLYIATDLVRKGYQTESQVKALIKDAIGVIENGSY